MTRSLNIFVSCMPTCLYIYYITMYQACGRFLRDNLDSCSIKRFNTVHFVALHSIFTFGSKSFASKRSDKRLTHKKQRKARRHSKNKSLSIEKASNMLQTKLENDIVSRHSQACLRKEGRDGATEATVWTPYSQYPNVLVQAGQRSVVEHTDDLPMHAHPLDYWRPLQDRSYFAHKRDYLGRITRTIVILVLVSAITLISFSVEIFVHQPRELLVMREELLNNAYGRVLELGAGQGRSVGLYPYPAHEIWFMDKDLTLLKRLLQRLPVNSYPSYNILHKHVEDLHTIPSKSFDCIADFFGLCYYQRPDEILKEMQRICKDDGIILLLEHGRAENSLVNRVLEWYRGDGSKNTHGCMWNRDLDTVIKKSGINLKEFRRKHFGTTLFSIGYPGKSYNSTDLSFSNL